MHIKYLIYIYLFLKLHKLYSPKDSLHVYADNYKATMVSLIRTLSSPRLEYWEQVPSMLKVGKLCQYIHTYICRPIYNHHHHSVLPKGRSFIANAGTKVAVLSKGRSTTANSGTMVAVLLGMNRCIRCRGMVGRVPAIQPGDPSSIPGGVRNFNFCPGIGCVSFVFCPVLYPAEALTLCWPHIQGGPPLCICLVSDPKTVAPLQASHPRVFGL